MQYRTLGRTGIQVSPYALGAMMFGAIGNPDHDDAIRMIKKALDAGINLIDTADVYSSGESEEVVGRAIKGRRADVVLATKFSNPMGKAPNQRGASRRWIMTAVEDSLRRLQTRLHRLVPVPPARPRDRHGAGEAGMSLTHMAMAFVIAHPGVTAALLGPRTMEQLDDLLTGVGTVLSDAVLDRIDVIVPPGTDVGHLEMEYNPPAITTANLRRRPVDERGAA